MKLNSTTDVDVAVTAFRTQWKTLKQAILAYGSRTIIELPTGGMTGLEYDVTLKRMYLAIND